MEIQVKEEQVRTVALLEGRVLAERTVGLWEGNDDRKDPIGPQSQKIFSTTEMPASVWSNCLMSLFWTCLFDGACLCLSLANR